MVCNMYYKKYEYRVALVMKFCGLLSPSNIDPLMKHYWPYPDGLSLCH